MGSNNTDSAKGPRDSVSWQAIDIYLFANGQQYSPPRKYHLQVDELNDWENTLSFMARAHYGPRYNTIQLYTTDGKKVYSPMELSNGGTYVAVVPPDPFQDSGYARYLLKASRSWERRQQLQWRTMEPSKPTDAGVTEAITEAKQDNTEVSNETKIMKPNQNVLDENPDRLTSSKPFKSNRRSIRGAELNIVKRISLASATKKSSIRCKKRATKRMSKNTGIKSKTSEVTEKDFNKNKVTVTKEKLNTNGDEVEYEILPKESSKTIILDIPIELDPAPSSATSIYANLENDTISVEKLKQDIAQGENNHEKEDEFRTITKQVVEKAASEISETKQPNMVFSENCVDTHLTLIKKGDIVSLKFQIEVKNADGVTTVIHEKKEDIVINLHRSLQINVEVDNLTLREQPDSLQASISYIYFHNHNGRPKVIILKCPCCDYQYSVDETQSFPLNTKNGQKVVIVMPVTTCGSAGTPEKIKVDKNLKSRAEEAEKKRSISTSASTIPQIKVNFCERVKNVRYDKCENEEPELQTIYSQKQSPLTLRKEITDSSAVKFRQVLIKKRSIEELKDKADASVLTDWCNMILEVKVEEDGRYSFYLPSLEKLRHYKL